LLYITLQLVAVALQDAGALDASAGGDPSGVRALFEGSTPLFGSIRLIPETFLLAFAGYATLSTGVLPRWTAWVAFIGAIIVFADAPTIYLGFSGLVNGMAGAAAAVAEFWAPVWILTASISLVRKKGAV
jgi:hypothetical protein